MFLSSMLSRNIPTVTLMMTKTNSWPTAPLTSMRSNNFQSAVNLLQMTVSCVTFNAAQQASYPSDNRTFMINSLSFLARSKIQNFFSQKHWGGWEIQHTLWSYSARCQLWWSKARTVTVAAGFPGILFLAGLHGWNNLSCFKLVLPCFLCAMWSACWRIKEEVMREFKVH